MDIRQMSIARQEITHGPHLTIGGDAAGHIEHLACDEVGGGECEKQDGAASLSKYHGLLIQTEECYCVELTIASKSSLAMEIREFPSIDTSMP